MYKKILKGESFLVLSAIIHGFFAIFVSQAVKYVPPILLAGISSFIPSLFLFFYFLFKKRKIVEIFPRKENLKYLIGVILFIVVIPSIFIFTGAKYTSSISTSILLQSEIIFTFIICTFLFNEKFTYKKFLATLFVFGGTSIVLFRDNLSIDKGAFLICLGTFFYPFGNLCQKKLLNVIDEYSLLFLRSLFGGIFLMFLSLFYENISNEVLIDLKENFLYIAASSLLIFLIAKIFWFKGLKFVEVTKGIPIVLSSPIFTLIFAYFLNGEVPTLYQITGILFTIAGIIFVF